MIAVSTTYVYRFVEGRMVRMGRERKVYLDISRAYIEGDDVVIPGRLRDGRPVKYIRSIDKVILIPERQA